MDLPDDIVREIFLRVACLSGPALLPPQPREPRVALSHVCAAWRRVALSTPELWSEVVIDDPAPDDRSVADGPGRSILRTWFSRSSQRLLSLEIARIVHGLQPLFNQFVFPNLHRCRKLKLDVTPPLLHRLFHSPGLLRNLEDLEVEVIGAGSRGIQDVINHEPITSFQVASKLRRVVLSLNQPYLDLPSLNLQWQRLSILAIRGSSISADHCLAVLQKCTSLEECEIFIADTHSQSLVASNWGAGFPVTFNRPVVLPFLHTIQLAFHGNHDGLSRFLDALRLPALRRFRPILSIAYSLPVLQLFLAPISHKLEELDISVTPWSSTAELRAFLAAFPNLTTLRLPISGPVPSMILQELATGNINPCSTSIQFGPIDMDLLLCFLEVRWLVSRRSGGVVSNITFVLTYCSRPSGGTEYARWTALEEAGIELRCHWS
ncbi:hypothetical protein BD779DRAFT_1545319 [Infundibulicybe gibba]|nr:hypothetical protein BD779DRAFT_1545319 [Infundibulicybe gibba]